MNVAPHLFRSTPGVPCSHRPPRAPRSSHIGEGERKREDSFRSTPGVPSFPPAHECLPVVPSAVAFRSTPEVSSFPPATVGMSNHKIDEPLPINPRSSFVPTEDSAPEAVRYQVFRSTPGVPSFPPARSADITRGPQRLPINPRSSFVPTSSRKSQVTPMT